MHNRTPEGQNLYWDQSFARYAEMFGQDPSEPATLAANAFSAAKAANVLELGAGQGRDALFFARQGFTVSALDYSQTGVNAITEKARAAGFANLSALRHDVRAPLPFAAESFAACYSHMLFCMALTTAELQFLSAQVHRLLKPGGLCAYTVRHYGDPNFERGTHIAENMYEYDGFIVHFFDKPLIEKLASGYKVLSITELEEGPLPRRLYLVLQQKM